MELKDSIKQCKKFIKTFKKDESVTGFDIQAIEVVLEELKRLQQDNYEYAELIKMQNKREYRSKFLKDFQKEFGRNTFPDYDEIYKRYDKQKEELKNSIPKERIEEIFDTEIYNMKYLSDTDWTEHQKEVDLEIANILDIIKQELLEDK